MQRSAFGKDFIALNQTFEWVVCTKKSALVHKRVHRYPKTTRNCGAWAGRGRLLLCDGVEIFRANMETVLAGLKTLGEKSNCLILCAMLEHNIAEVENEIF